MAAVKFPGPEDHVAVIGRNGSGKTVGGMWLLSGRDFDAQPCLIINSKGDSLIDEISEIKGVQTIDIGATPGEKGLYIVNPLPSQQEELNQLFKRCWEKENLTIFVDEGYSIQNDEWFNACLTQGRSKHVNLIVLSQRPAWISKYVFSECNFIMLFNLQIKDDRKKVSEFVPVDKNYRLPPYCSYWYNVKDNLLLEFAPVPNSAAIVSTFRSKFPPEQEQEPEAEAPAHQRPPKRRVV